MLRPALLSRTTALLPYLALLSALLLLSWTLAHWTWVFLTPTQQSAAPSAAAPILSKMLAEKIVVFNLFGKNSETRTENTEGTESAPAIAPSNISVHGIYSARNGRAGFAVLVVDGKTLSAVVGTEFAPGMFLQRVYPDYVEILRGKHVERVYMASGGSATAPASTIQQNITATPVLQMAVQQLGSTQYGFSRAALLATLKRADQITLLGRYGSHPRGGAVLERSPEGGLPAKLGLKVGDVIIGINGKPLSGAADVARLYELLTKSEKVSVDVLRAGEKMTYGIQVSP